MSFIFRSRRRSPSPEAEEEEGRSGGKIMRARRREPPASPYARPAKAEGRRVPLLPAPPVTNQGGSPRWILGLLSGAGRMISSAFRSEESSSSASDSVSGTGESEDEESGEDGDSHPLETFPQLTHKGENSEIVNNTLDEARAIIPASEAKLSIQKLLMQETFSRDECDRLKQLIETRVVDSPSLEYTYKGIATSDINTNKAVGSLEVRQTLNQNTELPKLASYSSTSMSVFSSKSPLVGTPELRNKAVMEAKKWLEEKKLTSPSKSDLVCGPCSFNTDTLNYGAGDEIKSPADLAKSYMRTIPPWQSPSVSSSDLMSPLPRMTSPYKDESPHETSSSLPSFKVFKRKYLSSKLSESTADARRPCVSLEDDASPSLEPKLVKVDLPETLFQINATRNPSVADVNSSKFSVPATETSNAPAKLCEELNSKNHDTEARKLYDDSGPEQTLKTVDMKSDASGSNVLEQNHRPPSSFKLPQTIKEGIVDSHLGTLRHPSKSAEPDDNSIPEAGAAISKGNANGSSSHNDTETSVGRSVPVIMPMAVPVIMPMAYWALSSFAPEELISHNANGSSSHNDTETSVGRSVSDDTLMPNNLKGQNLDIATKSQDERRPMNSKNNGSLMESSATEPVGDSNAHLDGGMNNPSLTASKKGESTTDTSEGHDELPSMSERVTPVGLGTEAAPVSSKEGARKSSVERLVAEPSPRAALRPRRAVAKVRRGRGRLKGTP